MPSVVLYVHQPSVELVAGLVQDSKSAVGFDPLKASPEVVWLHVVGTLNPEHISVNLAAHDVANKNRDEDWLRTATKKLAEGTRKKLLSHGAPKTIMVCVDGVLLPDADNPNSIKTPIWVMFLAGPEDN